jgi:ATP-dependent exoDNAse (exonuclease V) beta subunit
VIYQRIQNLPIWEKERAIRFYEIFKYYNETYKKQLKESNAMDFSEMILGAIKYLHK